MKNQYSKPLAEITVFAPDENGIIEQDILAELADSGNVEASDNQH